MQRSAIEGLRLKRDMPLRAEGDRGILSSSTQVEEKAVLQIENLTDEAWPVRLLDVVPYSEQEVEISYTADPAPSVVDVDGQRGVLAWEFELPAGEKKAVQLDSVMRWPEGRGCSKRGGCCGKNGLRAVKQAKLATYSTPPRT